MLAFFRKYEKTFLLLIFAPALLTLGISGVMLQVLMDDPADSVAGRLFGEEVTEREFQLFKQRFASTNQGADDEQTWRFWALLRSAEKAGVQVSDKELGDEIREKFQYQIAQYKATQEIRSRGLDPNKDEQARQEWWMLVQKHLSEAQDWDPKTYEDIIRESSGMSVRRFEEQERREAKVMRYMASLREMATVSIDDIWKEFQEQHHLRLAEVLPIPTAAFAPDLAVTDSASKAWVSPEQVKGYYQARVLDYDEPRRADVEYVALSIDGTRSGLKGEEIRAWYEQNKQYFIAAVQSGVAQYKDLDAEGVREQAMARLALEKIDRALDQVSERVAAARKAGQAVDLAAITTAVRTATGADLAHGTTGFVSREELADHEVLAGFAAGAWLDRVEDTEKVTDVLAGERSWFLLRARGLRPARTPRWEEVEGRAREDYARGSRAERRRWYEAHKTELQRPALADVEWAEALDEKYGGDHQKAKTAAEKAMQLAAAWEAGWSISKLAIDPAIDPPLGTGKAEKLDGKALAAHEVLGGAATAIPFSNKGELRLAERADKKGWVLYRVALHHMPTVPTFAEAEADVAQKVARERGVERAEVWVQEHVVGKLRWKTGAALEAALKELQLTPLRTEAFSRDATTLAGFPEAGRIVSEAFASTAVVGGPYGDPIRDEREGRVLLVRVVEKQDAPEADFKRDYDALRRDLVTKARTELAGRLISNTLLEAKGITPEHLTYARSLRDGPDGQVSLEVRQIFLPPDRDIIEGWLKDQARARIEEARRELAAGKAWALVVGQFSEDEFSRARGGQISPVRPGELRATFGENFEQKVWDLTAVDPNAPVTSPPQAIESNQGLHLVQRVGTREGMGLFRHLLVKTDAEARKLPDEVRKQADEASRLAIEKAWARLQAGEPFALVADEVGDDLDPVARGAEIPLDWTTPFERAALNEHLDWSKGEDHEGEDPAWIPSAVELTLPDGRREWHWFACQRDQGGRDRGVRGERIDREVYHITAASQERLERARRAMQDWMAGEVKREEGDRPGFGAIMRQFQELAGTWSEAPDKHKGGAFGLLRLGSTREQAADPVRPYGDEFLRRITVGADGKPTKPGHLTGPFRGATGWHLVEVTEVTTKPADDKERAVEVAQALLSGTDWR